MKKKKKKDQKKELLAFLHVLYILYVYILSLIGVRIAQLIISIINITNSFKLIYLLLIISFIIFCLSFILVAFLPINKKIILSTFVLFIIIIYGMDALCYYLYFNENINHKAILVLLIYSDCGNLPLLMVAIYFQISSFKESVF